MLLLSTFVSLTIAHVHMLFNPAQMPIRNAPGT